jgi:acetyltransferase-like isoleucine patch superfamily enzyme
MGQMLGNAYTECEDWPDTFYRIRNLTLTRRHHQPFWLKSILDSANQAYIQHFIRPQFEAAGMDLRVMYPRHLDISGPNINVGDHVHFTALPVKPIRLAVFEGLGSIDLGHYSIINPGVRITSASKIQVGESCMLAMNSYISDADWHDLNHRIFAPGNASAVTLANNVWIGDGALVTKGVSIGENSIVGARAVVTKSVPENVIVAGNPAVVVKQLSDEHITVRKDMFTMEQTYDEFERQYYRTLLANNGVFSWIKSVIWPGRKD